MIHQVTPPDMASREVGAYLAPPNRAALWLMVVCLLLAAVLRLSGLPAPPPGLHYDEAANGILAADIGLRGQRPVFIASYTGKEALFFYAAGGLMRLAGDSVFTLRLTSAFIGVLTVAATYWLGMELLADRRLALVAAALLAVSFWHVLFSRLGFRAISQPLLQALAVAALFRGFRRRSRVWVVFAGIALGLTAYTYLAARLFPIALILSLAPVLLGRQDRRRHWTETGLFVLVALVVLAPLLAYFLNNPEAFWVRINQVSSSDQVIGGPVGGYLKSLGMLFLVGDPYWRFNIPGRPLFNWFWGALLVAGWVLTLLHFRRRPAAWQRSAHLLLVLVPFFMVLPTALAVGEILPSNLRAIGLLPFITYLPAIGLLALVGSLGQTLAASLRRLPDKVQGFLAGRLSDSPAPGWSVVVLLILAAGGLSTARVYFHLWSNRSDVYYDSDADLVEVSRYLDRLERDDATLYLAALHYRHPTVAFLSDRYDQLKWLPESEALAFPASGPALYLFPHSSPLPEWAASFLPADPLAVGPPGPDGQPTFEAYGWTGDGDLPGKGTGGQVVNVYANFDNVVTLLAYEVGSGAGGGSLPVTLYWRVERPPETGYTPFVHFEDVWGYRWSQVETFAYPAEQWQPGDVVVQRVEVPLPGGLPPDSYRLLVGFFDPQSGRQLARLDGAGRYAGTVQVIEEVAVAAGTPPQPAPEPPVVLNHRVTPGLTLLGYEPGETTIFAGAPVWLSLWWQANKPLDPLLLRLELIRPDRSGRILLDTQPVHNTYPFASWSTPLFLIDHHTPTVPADTPPGDYTLSLRVMDAADRTLMTTALGSLTIEAGDRLFTPPKTGYPLDALFGNEIRLLGYDLERSGPHSFALSLVWQAAAVPGESYTVFVHLLDENGQCCIWQQDLLPQSGTYPTDRWLAGEVVVDDTTIDLPPDLAAGQYPLEIGLYVPETGKRLLATMPGLRDNDALLLRPLTVE